ncbi:MAG: hypothetical protein ABNH29_10705 [Paracoccus sp. (in: a-proteobacteria)]|jgi:hypothetical protein
MKDLFGMALPGTLRLDPLEASSLQIEPVNESIDKLNAPPATNP